MAETFGLDIGSHSIKLVGLRTASRGAFLTAFGVKEIPQRTDQEPPPVLIETLKALFEEHPIKSKRVRLTLSGDGVHLLRIILPALPEEELREAIRWEIKSQIPFPIETARIDYHAIGEFVEEGAKKLDLMVVACPSTLIEETLSLLEGTGLKPEHLDVAPFALWSSILSSDRYVRGETTALIDLGSKKTGIHLFKDGILQFSREITPSGKDITQAIIEGLGWEAGGPHVKRAEEIKHRLDILSENLAERPETDSFSEQRDPEEPIYRTRISFWVRPVLERLVAEIGRSLDYYQNQFNTERVDRILIAGGSANLKNIAPFLAKELRLPVERFNPLKGIPFDAKRIEAHTLDQFGPQLTIALGLALPQPRRIELLPEKEPFWPKLRVGNLLPLLVPLAAAFIFLWFVWEMNGTVASLQKDRDEKLARVMTLESLKTKLTILKEKESQIKQDLSRYLPAILSPVSHHELLNEVNRILPNNVALTLLAVQPVGTSPKRGPQAQRLQEAESLNETPWELHLGGLAFGSDPQCLTALAQIIEKLERPPFFKKARLISADENKQYNQPATSFEISCELVQTTPTKEEIH
jgi:type IV pilus assembly protein PilM